MDDSDEHLKHHQRRSTHKYQYNPLENHISLHYPPIYQGYKCPEMLELLDKYEVERCYYGHLHGYTHRRAFEGMREKTEYALIAADYVAFQPVKICN